MRTHTILSLLTLGACHLNSSFMHGDAGDDVGAGAWNVDSSLMQEDAGRDGAGGAGAHPLTQNSFSPKLDFPTGTSPFFADTGDLNGDGKLDVVTVNVNNFSPPGSMSILLNDTTSTPSLATNMDFTAPLGPYGVAIRDLNGDGRLDLAIANSGTGSASVFLNMTTNGASAVTLASRVDFNTAPGSAGIAVGDLNGDGKPDLAVANQDAANVSILLNTTPTGATMPTFAAAVNFATHAARGVAIADLNGDGKLDVVAANSDVNLISVLTNTTRVGARSPKFTNAIEFDVGGITHAVAIADLNCDGKPDIAVANNTANSVSILLNTTSTNGPMPTFAAHVDVATGSGCSGVAVRDLNNDGIVDVVATTAGNVSVIPNNTPVGAMTATFGSAINFTAGAYPLGIAIADLDGDQHLDLIVANEVSNNVSVLAGK